MKLDGAVLCVDHNRGWFPLYRNAVGWYTVAKIHRPGSYGEGDVKFPDGSTIRWATHQSRLFYFAAAGALQLQFTDGDEIGAEITRRMLALTA